MDKAYNDSLQIWKEVCEFKSQQKDLLDSEFETRIKEFHDKIAEKYPDFFYTFPVVGKLIVLSSMYNPKSMKKYLEYYFSSEKKGLDFEKFIDYQTDYIYYYWKDIYSYTKPGARKLSTQQIEQFSQKEKNKIQKDLTDQFHHFKSVCDQTSKDENMSDLKTKREKLKNFIINHVD